MFKKKRHLKNASLAALAEENFNQKSLLPLRLHTK